MKGFPLKNIESGVVDSEDLIEYFLSKYGDDEHLQLTMQTVDKDFPLKEIDIESVLDEEDF